MPAPNSNPGLTRTFLGRENVSFAVVLKTLLASSYVALCELRFNTGNCTNKSTRALEMVRLQKHVASMWLACIHSKLVFYLNSEVPVQNQSPEHSRGKCLLKIEICRSQLGVFYYNHYQKKINSTYWRLELSILRNCCWCNFLLEWLVTNLMSCPVPV